MKIGQYQLQIAEGAADSRTAIAALRWALVVIFLWFGVMKFTGYEAMGIAPLVSHNPLTSWLIPAFGVQGTSNLIGTVELATAAALAGGSFIGALSFIGAAMSCMTFLVTLTFFATTPGVGEATLGGFPAISVAPGQFLLKDLVLLAASYCLARSSLSRI
jgi:reactive chlorine resistance protein C